MDTSSLIAAIMPVTTLFTAIALPFIVGGRSGRSHAGRWKARPPEPGASDAARMEYLYVPCVSIRYRGYPAEARRWVQEVPIVKKTAERIYYTSDSWDRHEAVVGPGWISRDQFETDTRCRDDCRAGTRGYPAGVIPIPGDRRPGPAGRLFYATREAAENDLYRGERDRAERAASKVPLIKELRRAMADAHPDRGGTTEQFIQARHRYQTALRASAA